MPHDIHVAFQFQLSLADLGFAVRFRISCYKKTAVPVCDSDPDGIIIGIGIIISRGGEDLKGGITQLIDRADFRLFSVNGFCIYDRMKGIEDSCICGVIGAENLLNRKYIESAYNAVKMVRIIVAGNDIVQGSNLLFF